MLSAVRLTERLVDFASIHGACERSPLKDVAEVAQATVERVMSPKNDRALSYLRKGCRSFIDLQYRNVDMSSSGVARTSEAELQLCAIHISPDRRSGEPGICLDRHARVFLCVFARFRVGVDVRFIGLLCQSECTQRNANKDLGELSDATSDLDSAHLSPLQNQVNLSRDTVGEQTRKLTFSAYNLNRESGKRISFKELHQRCLVELLTKHVRREDFTLHISLHTTENELRHVSA